MRQKRDRVLRITINGTSSWLESADGRVVEEVQFKYITEKFPEAKSIRVSEIYIGGAKQRVVEPEEEDEDTDA